MNNIFKKITALMASSVCMLTFVGLGSHDNVEIANAAENSETETINFVNDPQFKKWGTSYGSQSLSYMGPGQFNSNHIDISFSNATRQTSTITDRPVSKDTSINYIRVDGQAYFTSLIFEFKQWGSKGINVTISDGTQNIEVKSFSNGVAKAEITIPLSSEIQTVNFNKNSGKQIAYTSITYTLSKKAVPTVPQQLTFDHNDGTPATPETGTYTKIPDLANYKLPDKDDKYFDGWYYEKENPTTKVNTGDGLESATTVYAKWTDFKTATFHYEDGVTQNKVIEKLKTDDTIAEKLVIKPEQEGFRFDDWTIGKGGEKFVFDGLDVKNPTKIKDASIDVYANWTEGHKVYYYLTEDAVEPKYTNTVYHGENAKVHTDPTGLEANQLFLYWYEKGTDGSKEFDFKNTKIMQNTNLVAKIVEKPTVTLKANNETVLDDTSLLINQELVITAETTGEASKVVWTIDNTGDAIKTKEENNKLTISGYKVGDAMITATVTDPKGTTYTDETYVTVSLNEFQKENLNAQYNLGATYTLVDEGPVNLTKVTSLKDGEYLNGKYIIVSEKFNYVVNGNKPSGFEKGTKYNTLTELNDLEQLSNLFFEIKQKDNGYTIKSQSGLYIGNNGTSSGVKSSSTYNNEFLNYISFDSNDNVTIKANDNNTTLVFNTSGNYFKYYGSQFTQGEKIQLYKLTGGVQFDVSEARAKFSFDLTNEFIKTNNVTNVGVRVGKDLNKIDQWEAYDLTSTKNGNTYTLSVKYTNIQDFANNVHVIPYVVIDGKTYDFNTLTNGKSQYYEFSVESIANVYNGKLESPKDQDFLIRLIDLIAKNK